VYPYRFIDLIAVATRLTGMVANPAGNGGEGISELDKLQGLLKFSLCSKVHISLDIDMRRTLYLTWRSLLFFSPGLAFHGITAVTLFLIHKNNLCPGIDGDRIFRTGQGTGCVVTMVAEQGLKERSSLKNSNHSGTNAKPMLLFTGYFACMAAHAFNFVKQQRYFSHHFPPVDEISGEKPEISDYGDYKKITQIEGL
jgi:hypothetical protein